MAKISLTNIAEELAVKGAINKETADNFIRTVLDTIEKGLREDKMVKIKGFGTFKLLDVSDRASVDINTGERITIKGYRKVSFTPDSAMKEFVNRPFSHFEPTELNDGYTEEEQIEMDEDSTEETDVTNESDTSVREEPRPKEFEVKDSKSQNVVEQRSEQVLQPEIELEQLAESETKNEYNVEFTVQQEVEPEHDLEKKIGVEITSVPSSEITEEHAEIEPAKEQLTNKKRKCSGCGWLVVILLIAFACIGYYIISADKNIPVENFEEEFQEYNEMMVNPNLEEEFGEEWTNEPKVETQLPIISVDSLIVKGKTGMVDSEIKDTDSKGKVASHETSGLNHVKSNVQGTNTHFCDVVLTASLEAKSIKEISPADTTDYIIDGTLVTHELLNGETIIQLAKRYYGDKRLWPYIVKYNWMKEYNNVAIGQMINIPVLKNKP